MAALLSDCQFQTFFKNKLTFSTLEKIRGLETKKIFGNTFMNDKSDVNIIELTSYYHEEIRFCEKVSRVNFEGIFAHSSCNKRWRTFFDVN